SWPGSARSRATTAAGQDQASRAGTTTGGPPGLCSSALWTDPQQATPGVGSRSWTQQTGPIRDGVWTATETGSSTSTTRPTPSPRPRTTCATTAPTAKPWTPTETPSTATTTPGGTWTM